MRFPTITRAGTGESKRREAAASNGERNICSKPKSVLKGRHGATVSCDGETQPRDEPQGCVLQENSEYRWKPTAPKGRTENQAG